MKIEDMNHHQVTAAIAEIHVERLKSGRRLEKLLAHNEALRQDIEKAGGGFQETVQEVVDVY